MHGVKLQSIYNGVPNTQELHGRLSKTFLDANNFASSKNGMMIWNYWEIAMIIVYAFFVVNEMKWNESAVI